MDAYLRLAADEELDAFSLYFLLLNYYVLQVFKKLCTAARCGVSKKENPLISNYLVADT